jgi:hypothetical protein
MTSFIAVDILVVGFLVVLALLAGTWLIHEIRGARRADED